eukprot:scaffold569_cov55-Attheya_sp.AAC.1
MHPIFANLFQMHQSYKPNHGRKSNDAETRQQTRIHPPTPQQSRIKFPKQYKQATIIAFATKQTQHQTAHPDNQNT